MGTNATIKRLHAQINDVRRKPSSLASSRSIFLSELLLARLERGITQAQLAKRAGLQQSAIARIESGKVNPKLDSLIKIAAALHCNLVLE